MPGIVVKCPHVPGTVVECQAMMCDCSRLLYAGQSLVPVAGGSCGNDNALIALGIAISPCWVVTRGHHVCFGRARLQRP